MKICYIYTDWALRPDKKYGGVGYYRVIKPAQYLSKFYDVDVYGENIKTLGKTPEEMWINIYSKYDVVIVKAVDNEIAAGMMMFYARHFNKHVILDLDDNYIEVRKDQPASQVYYPGSQKRSIFQALLSLVDGLIVSTQPLADFYKDRIKKIYGDDLPVFVAPNCADPDDWKLPTRWRKKVIGYAGSITHNSDLALVMPSIAKLMKENKDWYLELLGCIKSEQIPEAFKDFDEDTFRRVQIKNGTSSWKGYPALLCKQRWTVGLAPLIDDEFNRGKSHIKWMEYALAGIPTLASKVYPYSEPILGTDVIKHGETGLLFEDSASFEQHLCSLMNDAKLRTKIVESARSFIQQNWSYKDHIGKWHTAIETICNSPIRQISSASSKLANDTRT
jgi:glycosyltransferase involved in cell wall biosynthesis